jgi:hypothetical protein
VLTDAPTLQKWAFALYLAGEARRMERELERWNVSLSPLNRAHPVPQPAFSIGDAAKARTAASAAFDAIVGDRKGSYAIPAPGTVGVWRVASHHTFPVRVVDVRHSYLGGYVERLDDPACFRCKRPHYRLEDWSPFIPLEETNV